MTTIGQTTTSFETGASARAARAWGMAVETETTRASDASQIACALGALDAIAARSGELEFVREVRAHLERLRAQNADEAARLAACVARWGAGEREAGDEIRRKVQMARATRFPSGPVLVYDAARPPRPVNELAIVHAALELAAVARPSDRDDLAELRAMIEHEASVSAARGGALAALIGAEFLAGALAQRGGARCAIRTWNYTGEMRAARWTEREQAQGARRARALYASWEAAALRIEMAIDEFDESDAPHGEVITLRDLFAAERRRDAESASALAGVIDQQSRTGRLYKCGVAGRIVQVWRQLARPTAAGIGR